jgi:hypothetical protein
MCFTSSRVPRTMGSNPSIERTAAGLPVAAAHVNRSPHGRSALSVMVCQWSRQGWHTKECASVITRARRFRFNTQPIKRLSYRTRWSLRPLGLHRNRDSWCGGRAEDSPVHA